MSSCIFCKIVAGDIPAQIVARDQYAVAFLDVDPLADGHTLVVPTSHATVVEEMKPAAVAGLFQMVARIAGEIRAAVGAEGSTIGINNGAATGQTVPHVHVHIAPRRAGDDAGSVHTIFPFPRRTTQPVPAVAATIRERLDAIKTGRVYEAPTPEQLSALQRLIDDSTRTATAAVAESVAYPGRQMGAAELVDFWRSARLCAMTTVGSAGQPHMAPVHADIRGTTLHLVIYDNTVRRRDLVNNPRVGFTTWRDGAVAVVYGRAREVPNSLRPTRPGRSGAERCIVEIEVQLTRVYAMRAPD